MSKKLIDLEHISKSYDGELILDDLNLYIKENEFLVHISIPLLLIPIIFFFSYNKTFF